ncbi:MAG: cyclic nucleotide-binding domain-containing protein [bacterium]|nr:MAG: cyclic nucleotide-binding domain-containing protein [bacterium]
MSDHGPTVAECTGGETCENADCIQSLCTNMQEIAGCFSYLATDDLATIARYFATRHMEAGQILWEEGDPCSSVAFVVHGHLEIKKETEFPGKQVIVGIYGRGAVVGELCVLDDSPTAVSAVAMDDVDLLILSRQDFQRLLVEDTALGLKLLKGMLFAVSTRLKKSLGRLAAIF